MDETYYTVEQISKLLRMHPKTIQRYIREGKLRASKIGKGWRVTGHDLSVFTESCAYREAEAARSLAEAGAGRAVASSVVDVAVSGRSEAVRMMNALTAALNTKPAEYGRSSMQTQYIEPERTLRVTLFGDLRVVETLLSAISTLIQPEEEEIK